MTREELKEEMLSSKERHYVLQIATGVGKTRAALYKIVQWQEAKGEPLKVLILVPKKAVIATWLNEIEECKFDLHPTVICYNSIEKYAGSWDVVICDEGHHITERVRDVFRTAFHVEHMMILSATLNRDITRWIHYNMPKAKWIQCDLQEAIDDKVLSTPKIILIPLTMDNTKVDHFIENKGKKSGYPLRTFTYKNEWEAKRYDGPSRILCTQRQQYNEISGLIDWAKSHNNQVLIRTQSTKRLKWLATEKHKIIEQLMKKVSSNRTLLFCPSIEESNSFNYHCIHSKNGKIGTKNYEDFNEGKFKVLSCIGVLDEGVNLKNCRIGMFQMINASFRLEVQRCGRILRHKSPVLIFPYWRASREEEIIKDMLTNYDESYVEYQTIDGLKL